MVILQTSALLLINNDFISIGSLGRQGETFYGEKMVVQKCEHLTLIKHQRPDLTITRILFIVPLQSPVVFNPFSLRVIDGIFVRCL